ncbi:MAG: NAD(P)-dependent oxidoreductase [Chloroflexota bacterium]|nr:NAD(P)-dependent oxidoreductase [Chloroflexota bacterium]MDQ5864132.1 NAD(P)-dependent oxidoreductase [Chloroflexota bacterium]
MSTKVGVIGLGAMGLPMSRRLLQHGYDLTVVPHHNTAPAEQLARLGATVLKRPGEMAQACEVVITSVPDVPQVQEVLFGPGGLSRAAKDGLLYIDMSTITPTAAQEHYARLKEQGVAALDAPVSGGPARAADGTLTIMVGGDTEAFERGLPVLNVLGKNITHVGPAGSGQGVKLVNQLLISTIMVANAEALTLGVKAGVPLNTMLEVIGTSSGSNYLMQNWMTRTLFNDDLKSGFALDLLMKDLRAALSWAGELGLPTFCGAMSQQLYKLARTGETARLDYSVVASIYEEAAGVKLRLEAGDDR